MILNRIYIKAIGFLNPLPPELQSGAVFKNPTFSVANIGIISIQVKQISKILTNFMQIC